MPNAAKTHGMKSTRKNHKVAVDRNRHNAQAHKRQAKRKYKTNSPEWKALRDETLNADPYCVECRQDGLVRLATVVDHKDGDSWNNSFENRQGLCATHHNRKTAKQDGGFGNRKRR